MSPSGLKGIARPYTEVYTKGDIFTESQICRRRDIVEIDWAMVDWATVGTLSLIAFIAGFIGNVFSFGNYLIGAILTGIFFGALYVVWIYYLQAQLLGPGIAPA